MQALKALCEIRLEKDDIVGLIEDAIKPCKATRQLAKQTGVEKYLVFQGSALQGVRNRYAPLGEVKDCLWRHEMMLQDVVMHVSTR